MAAGGDARRLLDRRRTAFAHGGADVALVFALAGAFQLTGEPSTPRRASAARAKAIRALDHRLDAARENGKTTACFVVRLDTVDRAVTNQGITAMEEIALRTTERLGAMLREGTLSPSSTGMPLSWFWPRYGGSTLKSASIWPHGCNRRWPLRSPWKASGSM